jgi:hypothetical protein
VKLSLESSWLEIRFSGLDALLCVRRHLVVPYDAIRDVAVRSFDDAGRERGWRIVGGYWPGRLATGRFTWKRRRGLRQFWRVYGHPDRVLVIGTRWRDPARIVLAAPDVDVIAAELRRRATQLADRREIGTGP